MNRAVLILAVIVLSLLTLQTMPTRSQEKGGALPEQDDPAVSSGVTILRGDGVREEAEACPRGTREWPGSNKRRFCLDSVHPAFEEYLLLAQPPVAGRPFEEVLEIVNRHREELLALPGVQDVVVAYEGVLVWTTGDFSVIPDSLEGIPLSPQRAFKPADCGQSRDPKTGRCRAPANSSLPKSPPKRLPPPPGVIVLRPGGVREEAAACPRGFREHESVGGWRFCLDPKDPQPIPPLMAPPIAGIPFEEARGILKRNREDLYQLPGVKGMGLGIGGIEVYTDQPEELPPAVEGLPITPLVPSFAHDMAHTLNQQERPVHGALGVLDNFFSLGAASNGTLTGVALSEGKPWLIFPSHLVAHCTTPSFCEENNTGNLAVLNACPHYPAPGTNGRTMRQPTFGDPSDVIGYIQRWDPPTPTQPDGNGNNVVTRKLRDVAAAFLDDIGRIEGDGSLVANREIEGFVGFKGVEAIPMVGDKVKVISSEEPHVLTSKIIAVDVDRPNISSVCGGTISEVLSTREHQIRLDSTGEMNFVSGDSGSAVLNEAGEIVGMFNWANENPFFGGGTMAFAIREKLGFDKWYGPESVKDNTFGVWRTNSSGAGTWSLDNGSGRWDGCVWGSTQTTEDKDLCLIAGTPADLPITGDWINTGIKQIGFIRPSTSFVYLDRNHNGWNPTEGCTPTTDLCGVWGDATPNDLVVAGDWDDDGFDEIGRWNPPGSWWTLDNGNLVWDECGSFENDEDECAIFGLPSDRPVVGDWNNDGTDEIGVYRPSTGMWYLDANGNRSWDGCGIDLCLGPFGLSGDSPIAGDWTGTGGDKIGVFQPVDPFGDPYNRFTLDNGDGVYIVGQGEREQTLGPFGLGTDKPIVWNQSVVKAN